MKKRLDFIYLIIIIMPIVFILLAMSGGSPGGRSGSPGDNSNNCSSCHPGTPQQISGWISAEMPMAGYTPGESYTITLNATDASALRFGFELTAEDENGNKMGTFTIINSTETKLVNNNAAVTHTNLGFTPTDNSKSWSFDWTAPAIASGSVFFYAAVNAADGNGNASGDLIYLTNEEFVLNTTSVVSNTNNSFKVYPNPTNSLINISLPQICSNTDIKIYNTSGQLVFVAKPESLLTSIDMSRFSKGVYFVKTNNYQLQKVIIY